MSDAPTARFANLAGAACTGARIGETKIVNKASVDVEKCIFQ